jgi:superfamily I DNA/RNA helicase
MHRAKGLEFERVIIAGVTEGTVPLDKALADAEDEATREQIRKRERSLLYVSVTRAKREVIVTAHDTPSPWLLDVGG